MWTKIGNIYGQLYVGKDWQYIRPTLCGQRLVIYTANSMWTKIANIYGQLYVDKDWQYIRPTLCGQRLAIYTANSMGKDW